MVATAIPSIFLRGLRANITATQHPTSLDGNGPWLAKIGFLSQI